MPFLATWQNDQLDERARLRDEEIRQKQEIQGQDANSCPCYNIT